MESGDSPGPAPSTATLIGVALVIAAAAFLAYHRTFSAPLLFDDHDTIVGNPTIRQLWPPWRALMPPTDGSTTAGRPILNLSLALNYAAGGTAVRGYHVVNLALHTFAGLTLCGLLRRTFLLPRLRGRFGHLALPLAAFTALIWVLHPLATTAVTYVSQRAECLVGLFFLLTLYGFVRATAAPERRRWAVITVTACALGMASKEVMVSAPLVVWGYDRTFISGGFRAALTRRPRLYAALAATWLVLGLCLASMGGGRGVSAGFGQGISAYAYAVAQCEAIIHYLRLAVWPYPLVFDYGIALPPLGEVWPQAGLLALLLAGAAFACVRGTAIGFVALFFFAVLAPSSSFMPITTQTMAEHRLYLPLAAIITLLTTGTAALAGRRGLRALLVASGGLGVLTFARNHDYRSTEAIWHDTVVKRPQNPRAFDHYAVALSSQGRLAEAVSAFTEALRLNPRSATSHENLAVVLYQLGQMQEARHHYQAAVEIDPRSAIGHGGLGALAQLAGDFSTAARHLAEAARLDPSNAGYRRTLATALFRLDRGNDAIAAFRDSLRLDPTNADTHSDFGAVAHLLGLHALAVLHSREALRLNPHHPLAGRNLAAAEAALAAAPAPGVTPPR